MVSYMKSMLSSEQSLRSPRPILHQQHPAFGVTSRMAKRWIQSQLLGDVCVCGPPGGTSVPPPAPTLPQLCPDWLPEVPAPSGYLRLEEQPPHRKSEWRAEGAEYTEIQNDFISARAQLPVMFIATPKDKKDSVWTKNQPTAQEAYGEFALFFHDLHGGDVIGVLWKPSSFEPQPLKTTNVKGRVMDNKSDNPLLVPNAEAFIQDFEILGEGLVASVEAQTERWNI
ncbi:nucleolar protein 6-like [Xenopus laevis]|uniref:Nucleolar protein 6 n=1 Tax=Xenopus laevis TaxID=8355 RepID=A0A8J1M4I5_XENLA|nr:nucleolar protein 6-like [Xenopus laevis]XP_041436610.1 nucleolar protein 6-like [Xenopus laevis]